MTRDGTQSRRKRSFGVLGSVVTLLVASAALMAFTRRRPASAPVIEIPEVAASPAGTPQVSSSAPQNLDAAIVEAPRRRRRRLPRFLTGTLAGVTTGIALGITAAVLITIASPDVRAAVIVGAGFDKAPMPDGEYVGRVMAQTMNPNLAYADETGVTALLATAEAETEDALAVTPVARELEDNARLIFGVLAVLTVLMWSVIMLGLSGGGSKAVSTGVE